MIRTILRRKRQNLRAIKRIIPSLRPNNLRNYLFFMNFDRGKLHVILIFGNTTKSRPIVSII